MVLEYIHAYENDLLTLAKEKNSSKDLQELLTPERKARTQVTNSQKIQQQGHTKLHI